MPNRTWELTSLVNAVADSVMRGQSRILVVCHALDFAVRYVRPMIVERLKHVGASPARVSRHVIEVGSSDIRFAGIDDADRMLRGMRGVEVFYEMKQSQLEEQ